LATESANPPLKSRGRLLAVGLAALMAALAAADAADTIPGLRVEAPYWATRGTAARVLVMRPPESQLGVILLPGGHGNLNLDGQAQIGWGLDDFVLRTRASYAEAGLTTVIPDIPVDRKPPAPLADYRWSEAQADDLRAISATLGREVQRVFIIAYDRGATAVLNTAARHKLDLVSGVALISPLLETAEPPDAAADASTRIGLGDMPVLLIDHQLDKCSAALVAHLKAASAGRTAPGFHSVSLPGGSAQFRLQDPFAYHGDPCNKDARHALAGLEARVSATVIDWVKAQAAAQR